MPEYAVADFRIPLRSRPSRAEETGMGGDDGEDSSDSDGDYGMEDDSIDSTYIRRMRRSIGLIAASQSQGTKALDLHQIIDFGPWISPKITDDFGVDEEGKRIEGRELGPWKNSTIPKCTDIVKTSMFGMYMKMIIIMANMFMP